MTYNANIPQSNNNISVSQGNILTNFQQLNTIFAKDHYTWDDNTAANRGWQKQVTFPANVAAVAAGIAGIVHTVLGTAASQKFNGAAVPFFANSAGDFPMIADPLKGAGNDFSFKIGGLIFNCGFNKTTTPNPTPPPIYFIKDIVFNTPFVSRVIFIGSQNFTGNDALNFVNVNLPTLTGFRAISQINNRDFYYVAIGY